jgi:hypothetical protein
MVMDFSIIGAQCYRFGTIFDGIVIIAFAVMSVTATRIGYGFLGVQVYRFSKVCDGLVIIVFTAVLSIITFALVNQTTIPISLDILRTKF